MGDKNKTTDASDPTTIDFEGVSTGVGVETENLQLDMEIREQCFEIGSHPHFHGEIEKVIIRNADHTFIIDKPALNGEYHEIPQVD